MKYEVIEWWGKDSTKPEGWGVIILEVGKIPKVLKDGNVKTFPTKEQAKSAGENYVNKQKVDEVWGEFM